MIRFVALLCLVSVPALAQPDPIPWPRPPVISPLTGQQLPSPQGPIAMPEAPPVVAPTTVISDWQPRPSVELQALDKITARTITLSGKVGETFKFGSLSVAVRSCMARPPDQPQDATAFLDITDSRATALAFHGWMFVGQPSLTLYEHPVYDIRLTACRA